MRVLQTIGMREGRNTPFYYRRSREGVVIEPLRGAEQEPFLISAASWEAIWNAIERAPNQLFSVSEGDAGAAVPQNLYEIVGGCLQTSGDRSTDSAIAYVNAILVHEGTLQTYHGNAGGTFHRVTFRRSK